MFYSEAVLAKKGPLANIWLAAHWDRKLSKTQVVQTNINSSVRDMISGSLPPMALRLSGQLLLGVTKIYQRKTGYLLEDCSEAITRIKNAFKPGAHVDMATEHASFNSITIPIVKDLKDIVIPEPELDLDSLLIEAARNNPASQARTQDITMRREIQLPKDIENGRTGFGPVDENELPPDFNLDIEVGRRASERLSSIEVDRKETSDNDVAVPFSPLRTPSRSGSVVNFPIRDFEDGAGELLPWNNVNEEPATQLENMTLNSPNRSSVIAQDIPHIPASIQAKKSAVKKRRARLVDETIELPSSVIQAQVRDTSALLLPEHPKTTEVVSVKDLLEMPTVDPFINADTFGDLFKFPIIYKQTASFTPATELQEEQVFIDQMDEPAGADWYDAPYAEDLQVPVEPTPSIVNSPSKRSANEAFSEPSFTNFAKNTVHTIQMWQQVLPKNGTAIDFASRLISEPKSKRDASLAFFEVLVLQGNGFIKATQEKPFGAISISGLAPLFQADPTSAILH